MARLGMTQSEVARACGVRDHNLGGWLRGSGRAHSASVVKAGAAAMAWFAANKGRPAPLDPRHCNVYDAARVRTLMARLDVSQVEVARACGVGPDSLDDWLRSKNAQCLFVRKAGAAAMAWHAANEGRPTPAPVPAAPQAPPHNAANAARVRAPSSTATTAATAAPVHRPPARIRCWANTRETTAELSADQLPAAPTAATATQRVRGMAGSDGGSAASSRRCKRTQPRRKRRRVARGKVVSSYLALEIIAIIPSCHSESASLLSVRAQTYCNLSDVSCLCFSCLFAAPGTKQARLQRSTTGIVQRGQCGAGAGADQAARRDAERSGQSMPRDAFRPLCLALRQIHSPPSCAQCRVSGDGMARSERGPTDAASAAAASAVQRRRRGAGAGADQALGRDAERGG